MLTAQCFAAVPFYDGITLEEIGGTGVRWPEREAAAKLDAPEIPEVQLETPPPRVSESGRLTLGTTPSLWSSRVTEHSPALRFLSPRQRAELSAADAERLGIAAGDEGEVAVNGTRVRARAALRARIEPGNIFLIEGTDDDNATAFTNGRPVTVEVRKA
jgi:NADH-quinone oxidoreductase subunit G